MNLTYNSSEEILFGVQNGSLFGSLLFNIIPCNFFSMTGENDLASYASDNTPCVLGGSTDDVIKKLEDDSIAFFLDNQIIR